MQKRAGLHWTVLTFHLALGVLIACGPKEPPGWRPECPTHDTLAAFVDTSGNLQILTEIAASELISKIPEFHDCQRLIVVENNKQQVFGPLIGIFASIWLEPKNFGRQTPPPSNHASIAAVTILNYDTTEYLPLHIKPGISCLYVYKPAEVWEAKLLTVSTSNLPNNTDDDICNKALAEGEGTPLAVRITPLPEAVEVPAVTRWDWDPVRKEHYIGVKCGNTNLWCEVYRQGADDPTSSSSSSYPSLTAYSAKGWYDEQYLAVKVGGSLEPGLVMGTIFPEPNLDTQIDNYYDSDWKKVAEVALSGESQKYFDKFNFKAGPAPDGETTIHLCRGAKSSCIPEGETVNECDQTNEAGTLDPWWAMIVSDGIAKYRCVIRRTHENLTIPGTVRWRWVKDDEGMWIRCPGSCCQVT